MNIVCATDNNFIQHCAVTIVSILKNNPSNVVIYLLTEGLTEENELKLKNLTIQNGGEIHFIIVNSEVLKTCPMPNLPKLDHISIATYYRLLIPKLLPETIDKVIYLDCDIVIRQNLNELWNYSIDQFAVGAVYHIAKWIVSSIIRLDYPISFGYFNAGVLLINLKYWRENEISERLFEYLTKKRDVIVFHDQDALNGVLYDKCMKLPIKWNMLPRFFKKSTLDINDVYNGKIINEYYDYKSQMLVEIDNPAVVHYVSKPKPWDAMCDHPYKDEYFNYLKYTNWHSFKSPTLFTTFFKHPKSFINWLKEQTKRIVQGNPYFILKTEKI